MSLGVGRATKGLIFLKLSSHRGRSSQQHKVQDSPSNTSLTDSTEGFSNKVCAANRARMCIMLQPRAQEPPSSGAHMLASVDVSRTRRIGPP